MKYRHFWHICISALAMLLFAVQAQAHGFSSHTNIQWAAPDNQPLTLDIHIPDTGKPSYPVLVIYHGGGWLINDSSIMNEMSEYIVSHGEYVVANVNYRLLGDNNNQVTLNQIVEDVFGGLLWIKSNIGQYKGDASRIAVTGDSAGGHLASMILLSGRNLNSDGFAAKSPGFNPTWLPEGETAGQVAGRDGLKVQAAVISYGAFDMYDRAIHGFESDANIFWQLGNASPRGIFGKGITVDDKPDWYKAVSPVYLVPQRTDYELPPQYLHVAETDQVTPPEAIQAYVDILKKAGQPAIYKVYEGRNHAFLDNGCNEHLKICFDRDAPEALNDILGFLNGIFYP